ncbi:polyphosphate kinase 1 [Tunicatimonas pelagia]|uniref:polyphosphate kinase 1 n=1 Tax=Tunicatimonas pelagia TaxID=931531 RepID=UPI002666096C|nr:polyphosphate kinase 1 [Tunicatimonas pelagia]WKN44763.1 polyphosphate kinase 1 [Tunicatimonas pelagia]
MLAKDRVSSSIATSDFISRDLSWMKFNYRVLDQVKKPSRKIFEKLKFLAITSSNLDEFFMIRVGSLYNYIDYGKERVDYSGLREKPFRKKLLQEAQQFFQEQNRYYTENLVPQFEQNHFSIVKDLARLSDKQRKQLEEYFNLTIYPMLTPMTYDSYHAFPTLMNKLLVFGVVTREPDTKKDNKKLSFVQIPQNLPRFYEFDDDDYVTFVPIEEVVRTYIHRLFRNITIQSVNLFRITRNGDFTLDESDDLESSFVEEVRRKLKTRKTGRVVRIETESGYSSWMMRQLINRWNIDKDNLFEVEPGGLLDFTSLWQIVKHHDFRNRVPKTPAPVPPVTYPEMGNEDIFEVLKHRDILLHHPYNDIEPLLDLIEKSAEDPNVLAIKLTIYRLASESRITAALLKAAENGKHVSVLFELKARFDEENNMREAQRLHKAGCFVIYGVSSIKTHTKLLLIVRKDGKQVTRYVHMSSGNYNEQTAKLYTDLGLLSTNEVYAHDVSEFFNVITGHSSPTDYQYLITAPRDMREQLISLIRQEAENAKKELPSGIAIKINSLEDREIISELYSASQMGVPIQLIVRGICCIRPGRPGLSENITVRSIVGDFLEHSRIYYFHNNDEPKVYSGSADVMVRSFDRRLESLFLAADPTVKKQAMNIISYNLRDNMNTYLMQEDGSYQLIKRGKSAPFDIHKEFFRVTLDELESVKLF